MFASVFFYKDKDEKLKAGPLWDFDIAFGNYAESPGEFEDELHIANAVWFERLLQDKYFAARMRARYEELKPIFDEIPVILKKECRAANRIGSC